MPHAIKSGPSHAASAHESYEDFFVMCRKIPRNRLRMADAASVRVNLYRGMRPAVAAAVGGAEVPVQKAERL